MGSSTRHLKVGALNWPGWVHVYKKADGSLGYGGLMYFVFEDIMKKLNFTYTLIAPPDNEFGIRLANGSYTGLMGICQRKEVDVILSPMAIKHDRFQVADISSPFFRDEVRMLVPRPRIEKDLSGFLKPFSKEAWIILTIVLCASMCLASILNSLVKNRLTLKSKLNEDRQQKVVAPSSIFMVVVSEAAPSLPEINSGRIFIASWMLAGFIFQAAYSGVLTSILAVPKVQIPIDSLEDLVEYRQLPWGMRDGSALKQYLMASKSSVHQEIAEKSIYVQSMQEAIILGRKQDFAMIAAQFVLKKIMDIEFSDKATCNYYLAKQLLVTHHQSLHFPKGSELVESFDKWLAAFRESGIIEHLMEGATANASLCMVRPGKEEGQTIVVFSMMDLAGVFLLLVAGLAAGSLTLLVELLIDISYRK